jgi:antitoxin (DNA-binding transcriptional repressor) of toxin-antitoxin stability system
MKVGTRELKNRLSYYLRRVREGDESVFVTDHGEVVAELKAARRPPASQSDRAVLAAMAERGDLTMGTGRYRTVKPVKLKKRILFSRRVLDDRR